MAEFDSILFDFDGVLADTEPVHHECWAAVLEPEGVFLTWDYYSRHCVGLDDREMLRRMAASADPPADWEKLWALYPRKKEMFRGRTLSSPPFAPGLGDFLSRLHREYKLAVVTSSARTEIEPLLAAGGIDCHFDTLVCGRDVEHRKPAPDPYLLAARRLDARSPLAVEDSETGIASAKAAGFEVLAVPDVTGMPEAVTRRLRVCL